MEEILEILDFKTGLPTGETAPRSQCHARGWAHKAVHLWARLPFEGQACYLFQQRSFLKPNYPGIFVATVGGHVSAGEGKASLRREAAEEVGLELDLDRVVYLESHPFVLELPGYHDYEWIDEYFYEAQGDLSQFSFPDQEVIGLGILPQSALARLVADPTGSETGWYWQGREPQVKRFTAEHFIPKFWEMPIARTLAQGPTNSVDFSLG